MPFSCPNKNTPEWKKLFLAVGKDRAYELYTENNFDIPTNFVVRAQDIRKIIKLYKTEIGQDKLIKVKKALDRYNTVNNTSHSLDITPIGESTESKVKLVLNFNPRNAQRYQDKLDRRSEEDKMFKELEEESETEEFVRDINYFMGDEQLMQQEDGVFYQTEKPVKPGVSELFESNPELANEVYKALGLNIINESEITYTDEEGNPCAKMGLTNTVKGTDWKIVKDFKGKPKHSNGGVDITISDNGISMRRGGKDIKAKFGLLIAANGLNMSNPDIPPFDEWYKTVPEEKNDTTSYNLRRAYELAPREQLDAFINDKDAHLYSVYKNPESGEYEFMKSKNHPTLKYEIDWYNSEEGKEFRDNYDLDTSGEYYKYIPKNKTNEKN